MCAIMAGTVALKEPVVIDSGRLVVNVYFVRMYARTFHGTLTVLALL